MAAIASNKKEPGPIVISYSDCLNLATNVYQYLKSNMNWPIWMDEYDCKSASRSASVAAAIQGCSAVVCFLTPGYQATVEREEELSYARNMKKPIIKCIVGLKNEFDGYENDPDEDEDEVEDNTYDWQPSAWLGIMVSDFISVSFEGVNEDNIERKCDELIRKLQNILGKEPSK